MTSGAPFVSLVVVNRDGREFIERLFASIDAQEGVDFPFEAIVVDNASMDGSVEWLERSRPSVRVLRNPRNEGFAGPANRGAEAARGTWVAFLNNDQALHPRWMAAMAARARRREAPALSGKLLTGDGRHVYFAGGGLNYYGYPALAEHGRPVAEAPPEPDEILFPCGGAMWVDRGVFLDAEGFDADYFAYFEDADLGWRLRLLGHAVRHVPEALSLHVGHGTSSRWAPAKSIYHLVRNMLWTLTKNLSEENVYRILCAAILMINRRGVMQFRLPYPDVRFPGESFLLPDGPVAERRGMAGFFRKALRLSRPELSGTYGESLACVRAMDAVLGQLEPLWEKRRRVQARRKVPDAEIFKFFRDPLHAPWSEPEFLVPHRALFETLRMNELFSCAAPP